MNDGLIKQVYPKFNEGQLSQLFQKAWQFKDKQLNKTARLTSTSRK